MGESIGRDETEQITGTPCIHGSVGIVEMPTVSVSGGSVGILGGSVDIRSGTVAVHGTVYAELGTPEIHGSIGIISGIEGTALVHGSLGLSSGIEGTVLTHGSLGLSAGVIDAGTVSVHGTVEVSAMQGTAYIHGSLDISNAPHVDLGTPEIAIRAGTVGVHGTVEVSSMQGTCVVHGSVGVSGGFINAGTISVHGTIEGPITGGSISILAGTIGVHGTVEVSSMQGTTLIHGSVGVSNVITIGTVPVSDVSTGADIGTGFSGQAIMKFGTYQGTNAEYQQLVCVTTPSGSKGLITALIISLVHGTVDPGTPANMFQIGIAGVGGGGTPVDGGEIDFLGDMAWPYAYPLEIPAATGSAFVVNVKKGSAWPGTITMYGRVIGKLKGGS